MKEELNASTNYQIQHFDTSFLNILPYPAIVQIVHNGNNFILDANIIFQTTFNLTIFKQKNLAEILPGFFLNPVQWNSLVQKTKEINDKNNMIEWYCKPLNKWFMVNSFMVSEYHLLTLIVDISKRKEIEEINKKESIQYKILTENITDVVWTMNLNLETTYVSPSIKQLTGYTQEEHLAKTIDERFTPETLAKVKKDFNEYLHKFNTGIINNPDFVYTGEVEYYKKNGGTVWTEIKVKPIFDTNKNIIGIQGISRDISQRREIEKTLKTNEEKFRLIFELSPDPVTIIDTNGIVIDCNYETLKLLELDTKYDFIGKPCFQFLPSGILSYAHEKLKEVIQRNVLTDIEFELISAKGNSKTLLLSGSVIRDEQNNIKNILLVSKDITARKKAEAEVEQYKNHLEKIVEQRTQELIISEKRYHEIFNSMRDGFIRTNKHNIIEEVNPAFITMTGIETKSIIGQNFTTIIVPESLPLFKKNLNSAKQKGYTDLYPATLIQFDKQTIPTEIQSYLFIEEGKHQGYYHIIRDITLRKQAEDSLKASEEKFRTIVQNLHDAICIIDIHGIIKYLTPSVKQITGYTEEQLMSKNIFQYAHPDDLPEILKRLTTVINKTNTGTPLEFRFKIANGKYITMEATAENLLSHPEIKGIVITSRDISKRKEAENILFESEARFKAIFHNTPLGILLVDKNAKPILFNNAILSILQCSEKELTENGLANYTHPDDIQKSRENFQKLVQQKINSYRFEKRFINTKNEIIWAEVSVIALFDKQNKFLYALAIINNITEQKHSIEQIKLSEEKFRSLFNLSTDGITITDLNGNYLEVNQMAITRTGLSREQFLRLNINDILKEPPEKFKQLRNELIKNKSSFFESNYQNKNGQKIYIEIHSKLINYEGKQALLHITRDITERKKFEQQLIKAIFETEEKERNRFAQDLHDGLGALLSGIKMYINLLHKGKIPEEQKQNTFEKINDLISEAVNSTREIANNIKPSELSKFGLVTSIETFIERIQNASAIKFTFAHSNYKTLNDEIELIIYRIVCELINNTIKYANAKHIKISLAIQKEKLTLQYTDDGIGFNVSKELKDKKGMGLNNIINRIRSIKGRCHFSSKKNQGMSAIIEIERE